MFKLRAVLNGYMHVADVNMFAGFDSERIRPQLHQARSLSLSWNRPRWNSKIHFLTYYLQNKIFANTLKELEVKMDYQIVPKIHITTLCDSTQIY